VGKAPQTRQGKQRRGGHATHRRRQRRTTQLPTPLRLLRLDDARPSATEWRVRLTQPTLCLAAQPASREEWATTLDPRSERAISATAAAARRKGVWEISKELRGGEAHDIALTVQ